MQEASSQHSNPNAHEENDLAHAVKETTKCFLFNCTRDNAFISYDFLEQLKDGLIFSGKYQSDTKILDETPHVVVEHPDMKRFTEDRYDVMVLPDGRVNNHITSSIEHSRRTNRNPFESIPMRPRPSLEKKLVKTKKRVVFPTLTLEKNGFGRGRIEDVVECKLVGDEKENSHPVASVRAISSNITYPDVSQTIVDTVTGDILARYQPLRSKRGIVVPNAPKKLPRASIFDNVD